MVFFLKTELLLDFKRLAIKIMICPNDREQMVNFSREDVIQSNTTDGGNAFSKTELVPLPSGGISKETIYETWYVYECPACGRQVKESYRCEVLLDKK